MIPLSGHESLKRLIKTIEKDPSIRIHHCDDGKCVYIQPRVDDYRLGVEFVKQIYVWLCHGEYPRLRVINVFPRYDLNSLKVCVNDEEKHESYRELIDCIEDHDLKGLKPYEHH